MVTAGCQQATWYSLPTSQTLLWTMMLDIQCDLQNVINVLCNKVSIFVVIRSRMTFIVIGTAALKLRISQLIKDMHAGRSASCQGMMGIQLCVHVCIHTDTIMRKKQTQSCVLLFLVCVRFVWRCMCVCVCVCLVMCEAHLLLKGCYMPGEHTLILSVVCLPLTGALLTLTHKDMSFCVFVTEQVRIVCACLCVCVFYGSSCF